MLASEAGGSTRGSANWIASSGTGSSASAPKPSCSRMPAAAASRSAREGWASSKPQPQCFRRRSVAARLKLLPVDSPHQIGERHLLPGRLLVRRLGAENLALVAPRRARIGEQLLGAVQDVVDRLRFDRVQDLTDGPD